MGDNGTDNSVFVPPSPLSPFSFLLEYDMVWKGHGIFIEIDNSSDFEWVDK